MTMTSVTLETTGIAKELNESGKWRSVKQALMAMQRETDGRTMQVMGSAPEYAVGSVHAVTEMGDLVIASNTGSQLPAYAYGADHVIFVVGAQKIVPTFEMAMERLDSYVLPLESDRAHRAYGVEKSNVSKLLVIHNEVRPERIHVVIVRESLGF
jgi:L-lactate utilization protein LutC